MTAVHRLAEPLQVLGRVFRNGDLRRLELAWAASNLASRASAIAVAVYAYETDGVGAVGIIAFIRLSVAAAASPWLAVLADRRPRRQVLIGIGSRPLPAARRDGSARAWSTLLRSPSTCSPCSSRWPSRSSDPHRLPSPRRSWRRPKSSPARTSSRARVESVGLFAGTRAGGASARPDGYRNGVRGERRPAALVSVALVARIGVAGSLRPTPRRSRSHTLLAGWRAIVSEPSLRVVIGLFSAQTLVAGMLNVLVVVLAIELLDLGTAGVGWLDGMVGIGATLGVLAVAGLAGRRRLSRILRPRAPALGGSPGAGGCLAASLWRHSSCSQSSGSATRSST